MLICYFSDYSVQNISYFWYVWPIICLDLFLKQYISLIYNLVTRKLNKTKNFFTDFNIYDRSGAKYDCSGGENVWT